MNLLKSLLCRHGTVDIQRAHPQSPTGIRRKGQEAWVDAWGVLNFLHCARCGKALILARTEHVPEKGQP